MEQELQLMWTTKHLTTCLLRFKTNNAGNCHLRYPSPWQRSQDQGLQCRSCIKPVFKKEVNVKTRSRFVDNLTALILWIYLAHNLLCFKYNRVAFIYKDHIPFTKRKLSYTEFVFCYGRLLSKSKPLDLFDAICQAIVPSRERLHTFTQFSLWLCY